jgi:plasmid stabilization system protein ParE
MAKRIIWSESAERIFTQILEFYIERNGSKVYSRKLNDEVLTLLSILSKQPFLGIRTEIIDVRLFIKRNYKIFYQIEEEKIIILLIWDCRQNPQGLNLVSKS